MLLFIAVLASVCQVGWSWCKTTDKTPAPETCCYLSTNYECCRDTAVDFCYCNPKSSQIPAFCVLYHNATTPTTECCGKLYKETFWWFPGYTKYIYKPTYYEKAGICQRVERVSSYEMNGETEPHPGYCYCQRDATECFATTTSTSTTTTTTTTTTTSTTTTTPKPLCPAPPMLRYRRMLGGTTANSCSANGVLKFNSGTDQMCNGVLAYNPETNANQIYITDFCKGLMIFVKNVLKLNDFGTYNGANIPNPTSLPFTAIANNISYFASPASALSSAQCQSVACLYNGATMKDAIDFTNCYISSFGDDVKGSDGKVGNSGMLNNVAVKQGTCQTKPITRTAKCFVAVDPNVRGCWGDNGAPVYCRLKSTRETVLYGMLDVTGSPPPKFDMNSNNILCADNNEFHVLPVS